MTDLDSLVRELLALDPALAAREADVRALAQAMLRGRPDAPWRPEFRDELRARLDAEILRRSRPSAWSRALSSLGFLLAGAAATAAVAVVVRPDFFAAPRPSGTLAAADLPARVPAPSITKREPGAFGTLAFLEPAAAPPTGMGGAGEGGAPARLMAKAAFAPEGAAVSDALVAPSPEAASKAAVTEAVVPAPTPVIPASEPGSAFSSDVAATPAPSAVFSYDGPLELSASVTAYRLAPSPASVRASADAARALADAGLPVPADGVLRSAAVALTPEGLVVSADVAGGTVSGYREAPLPPCPAAGCADVPDALVLRTADALLRRLGVNPSAYGAPSVRRFGSGSAQAAYPVLAAGLPTFEEYGAPRALTVDVGPDARVTGLFGALPASLEASDYPAAPEAEVRVRAAGGGLSGLAPAPGESLGAPSRALAAVARHDGARAETVLAPVLAFPVLGTPAGEPRYVLVPLAAAPDAPVK